MIPYTREIDRRTAMPAWRLNDSLAGRKSWDAASVSVVNDDQGGLPWYVWVMSAQGPRVLACAYTQQGAVVAAVAAETAIVHVMSLRGEYPEADRDGDWIRGKVKKALMAAEPGRHGRPGYRDGWAE